MKQLIERSRRVTICVDGWSKKGRTSSFLGISACFFDPVAEAVHHVVLKLAEV